MQIIKDTNNVVLFVGEGFELTETGLKAAGFVAPTITSKKHTIEKVNNKPANFRGGYFTYDKKWKQIKDLPEPEPTPQETAKQALADLKTAQEGKPLSMAYIDKRLTEIETILGV